MDFTIIFTSEQLKTGMACQLKLQILATYCFHNAAYRDELKLILLERRIVNKNNSMFAS